MFDQKNWVKDWNNASHNQWVDVAVAESQATIRKKQARNSSVENATRHIGGAVHGAY
jgi:hypothetical protein